MLAEEVKQEVSNIPEEKAAIDSEEAIAPETVTTVEAEASKADAEPSTEVAPTEAESEIKDDLKEETPKEEHTDMIRAQQQVEASHESAEKPAQEVTQEKTMEAEAPKFDEEAPLEETDKVARAKDARITSEAEAIDELKDEAPKEDHREEDATEQQVTDASQDTSQEATKEEHKQKQIAEEQVEDAFLEAAEMLVCEDTQEKAKDIVPEEKVADETLSEETLAAEEVATVEAEALSKESPREPGIEINKEFKIETPQKEPVDDQVKEVSIGAEGGEAIKACGVTREQLLVMSLMKMAHLSQENFILNLIYQLHLYKLGWNQNLKQDERFVCFDHMTWEQVAS